MSSQTEPTPKPAQKHRACDECRSRKLACSKDDNGCSRCMRENITCVYSEQKPMGRPRKRKCIEQRNAVQQGTIPEIQEPDVAEFDFGLLDEDFGAWDDGLFLDSELFNDPCMFGSYQSNELPLLESESIPRVVEGMGMGNGCTSTTEKGVIWHFGNDAFPPNVNFGPSSEESDSSSSNDPNANTSNPPNTPPSPTLDYSSILNLDQESTNPQDNNPIQCSCLASLYLSLSSLQILPTSTTLAVTTIRRAAYTAQTVMRCPHCATCPITDSPPMLSLQNHMLLGTLLPVIADSYKRLLKMIDDRYARALLSTPPSKIPFQPGSYGGFKIRDVSGKYSCEVDLEVPRDMEAEEWRAATRAFLRADVYGLGDGEGGDEYGGLRGLIREMEVRQRRRHDLLDRLKGEVEEKICQGEGEGEKKRERERDRTCERILDLARDALEGLVIA